MEEMSNWMIAAEEILKGIPFDPSEIQEVSSIYGTDIRDGTKELFQKLCRAKVPVLVFSAGLGDIVEAVLRNEGVLFNNVKVNTFCSHFCFISFLSFTEFCFNP